MDGIVEDSFIWKWKWKYGVIEFWINCRGIFVLKFEMVVLKFFSDMDKI